MVEPLNQSEAFEAIENVLHLKDWRYADRSSDQSRQTMNDGLTGADLLVAAGRSAIPSEVRFQGLCRILQLNGEHRQQLVEALFKKNAKRSYWEKELLGRDQELDTIIKGCLENS
jgi:hypothetical protein